jgi:hypothetical protein
MKKALTDTGLIKKADEAGATKRKSSGKKGGKAASSSVSAPKARKTTSKRKKTSKPKKTAEPKKPRKQGGTGRPFQAHSWPTYAPGNKAPRSYSEEELKGIVKKAAKAANTRLRTLEKKGLADKAPAYKSISGILKMERPRFKESTAKMTKEELTKEFLKLREFMGMKTSTMTGYKEWNENKVQAARDMGFTGTPDELAYLFNRYMTEKNEALFGSDIIYQAIVSNNIDKLELEQIGKEYQANLEKDISQGERLLQLYRARQGRK